MDRKILVGSTYLTTRSKILQAMSIGNFRFIYVSSWQELLDEAAKEKPDLIIVEVGLPGIDGLERANLPEGQKIIILVDKKQADGIRQKLASFDCTFVLEGPPRLQDIKSAVAAIFST